MCRQRNNHIPALQGKVAIVIGAASPIGLGHAMTVGLVRAGARVAPLDHHMSASLPPATPMPLQRYAGGNDLCVVQAHASGTPRVEQVPQAAPTSLALWEGLCYDSAEQAACHTARHVTHCTSPHRSISLQKGHPC